MVDLSPRSSTGKTHPGEQSPGCTLAGTETTRADQRYYLGVVKKDKSNQRKCSSTHPFGKLVITCVYMNPWTPPYSHNTELRQVFLQTPLRASGTQHVALTNTRKPLSIQNPPLSLINIKYFKISTIIIITLKNCDEGS